MRLPQFTRLLCATALLLCPLFGQDAQKSSGYVQTNLVSSVPGLAAHTDANLVNAWGTAFIGPGPWWVNAAGTGLSILYDPNGGPFPPTNPLIVTIPPPAAGGPSVPTGIVSNTSSDFQIAQGKPALFLFASARGTISGWNSSVDSTHALLKVTTPGASYLGITIGQNGGANMLYAADFKLGGTIDVFDGSFNPVTPAPGAFRDPTIPSGYAPFNVLDVGGSIYVMFAEVGPNGRNAPGPGLGYVDQFSPNGTLIGRLQHGNWMNSPWGIAMAPRNWFRSVEPSFAGGQFRQRTDRRFQPHYRRLHGDDDEPHRRHDHGGWFVEYRFRQWPAGRLHARAILCRWSLRRNTGSVRGPDCRQGLLGRSGVRLAIDAGKAPRRWRDRGTGAPPQEIGSVVEFEISLQRRRPAPLVLPAARSRRSRT